MFTDQVFVIQGNPAVRAEKVKRLEYRNPFFDRVRTRSFIALCSLCVLLKDAFLWITTVSAAIKFSKVLRIGRALLPLFTIYPLRISRIIIPLNPPAFFGISSNPSNSRGLGSVVVRRSLIAPALLADGIKSFRESFFVVKPALRVWSMAA